MYGLIFWKWSEIFIFLNLWHFIRLLDNNPLLDLRHMHQGPEMGWLARDRNVCRGRGDTKNKHTYVKALHDVEYGGSFFFLKRTNCFIYSPTRVATGAINRARYYEDSRQSCQGVSQGCLVWVETTWLVNKSERDEELVRTGYVKRGHAWLVQAGSAKRGGGWFD